jgi:peptidyl-Lys metalloendopeptidase
MRSTSRIVTVAGSLVLASCALDGGDAPPAADPPAPELGLVSHVDVASDLLGKDDHVVVHWSLTNEGTTPLALPRWQVPGAELEANVFGVTRDGEPVRYTGKLVKRAAPSAADLVELAPGATIAADVELSRFYEMGHAGEYVIRHADARLPISIAGASPELYELASDPATTLRTDDAPDADAPLAITPDALTPSFRSCSSTRQGQLITALGSAQTYASGAESYMNSNSAGPRYTTWFGTYSSSRYSKVKSHYTALRNTIQNKGFTFDCSCTDSGTYAYVNPNQPYVVYLCGAFWSAPNTGTDSRAGTIIHETSHFTVVAGTDDWVYGQTGCKNLAKSNPSHAIDNADSHEYFAENKPAQN